MLALEAMPYSLTVTATADLKEIAVMEEVKTIADAVAVLSGEGVPAADFDGTVEGAIKIAKNYGLSFPNLKAE